MSEVAIATEDEVSELLCKRLLDEVGLKASLELRRNGNGYLKSRMGSFCAMAQMYPVVVLTDLDDSLCAPDLVNNWLRNLMVPRNLLFRVAVREVEAWLLADVDGIRDFFGVRTNLGNVDGIADPKQAFLEAMRRSSRAVRNSLVDVRRGQAFCGVGYNSEVRSFISDAWSPVRAAQGSDSLRRMRVRLSELSGRI